MKKFLCSFLLVFLCVYFAHAQSSEIVLDQAEDILITDAEVCYAGDTVEDALQEICAGTTLDDRYVEVAGDTMTGDLDLGGKDLDDVGDIATDTISPAAGTSVTLTGDLTILKSAGPGVARLFIDNPNGIGNTAVSLREDGISRFDFTYGNNTNIAKLQALEAESILQLLGDNGLGITVDENGNVGIGTAGSTALDAKLSIQSPSAGGIQTIRTIKNSSGGTRIKYKFDPNNIRWHITDRNNGIDFTYDEPSGFIGIGIDDPLAILHIKDNAEQLRLEDSSATGSPFLTFYQDGTRRSFIQHVDTDDDLKLNSEFGNIAFWTGTNGADDSQKAELTSGGFFGVGDGLTPLVRIHSKGNNEVLRLEEVNSDGNPFLTFFQNGTRRSFIQHNDTSDNLKIASEFGQIQLLTGPGGTELPRVTIQSNGEVGIGDTAPDSILHIKASRPEIIVEGTGANGASGGAVIFLDAYDGTVMETDERLGFYLFRGRNSIGVRVDTAGMRALVTENWVGGGQGTKLQFYVTPNGNTARIPGLTIENNENLTIGSGRANAEYTLKFNGETNQGSIVWMEDEDYFKFNDDLLLDTGLLFLNETTTPTAIANHGAIYTKNNNELFFQDGAGIEHLLHGDAFSNLWFHGASTTVTIGTQNTFTKITIFENVGDQDDLGNVIGSTANDEITISSGAGASYDITFHVSITAVGANREMIIVAGIELAIPLDITNVTDNGISPIVITSTAHGLLNGDMVEIADVVGNTAANGSFMVANKAADTFEIVILGGGATTGNGDYNEGSPTGDVTIKYPGNLVMHRDVSQTNLGVGGVDSDAALADGDKVALYVANLDAASNLNMLVANFKVSREGD